MAFGRNQRFDSRRSSSYCSTATLIVFVSLCLVGVWMMTSTTVVPVEMSTSEKSEVTDKASETVPKPSKDFTGNENKEAAQDTKSNEGISATKFISEDSHDQKTSESSTDNSADSKGEKDDSVDASKSQTFSDESGTGEGGEVAKTTEDIKDGQNANSEQNAVDTEQERDKEQNSDKEASSEQNDKSEENANEITGNEQQPSDRDKNSTESQLQQSDDGSNSEEIVGNEQQPENENDSDKTAKAEKEQSNNMKNSEQDEKSDGDIVNAEKDQVQIKEKVEESQVEEAEKDNVGNKTDSQVKDQVFNDVFPDGAQSDLLNETNTQNGAWSTQATESKNEKEVQASSTVHEYDWKLCNVTAKEDYIPCLDNVEAIKKLQSTRHYEHRERHCPEEGPTCLVSLPKGYQKPIEWPTSRDKIWYSNVPHTKLAVVKGHQNWVKVSGEYLIFPGGGTQFKNGALHYIDAIQESLPDIAWGKRSRVILDVGCGVASFGGYLFERDALTMSFAPKDEHEAQVQFALERGIPAISSVMGTKRLPFPSMVFDVIHCARCRVPWHIEGGKLLLELNRMLRPGGYFVWSATPVYQTLQEDQDIWNAMSELTKSMCWEMVAKRRDAFNQVGWAIYRKPSNNTCYEKRQQDSPPLCQESDDPNAAWNIQLQACMHKLPVVPTIRGSLWPDQWPQRLEKTPYWLNSSQTGVYGKPAPEDFQEDYKHWKKVIDNSYMNGMGFNWSNIRNVMDMRSVYGGFAAALRDMKVWVMNIVSIDSPDTLPIIYERGLIGIYHDWCESFSTYPRTYDLLHADHLFSRIKKRCKMLPVFVEVDRILRPEGKLIVRDKKEIINELENVAKSLKWDIRMTYVKGSEGLLCVQKTMWRPEAVETSSSTTS